MPGGAVAFRHRGRCDGASITARAKNSSEPSAAPSLLPRSARRLRGAAAARPARRFELGVERSRRRPSGGAPPQHPLGASFVYKAPLFLAWVSLLGFSLVTSCSSVSGETLAYSRRRGPRRRTQRNCGTPHAPARRARRVAPEPNGSPATGSRPAFSGRLRARRKPLRRRRSGGSSFPVSYPAYCTYSTWDFRALLVSVAAARLGAAGLGSARDKIVFIPFRA
jgi:hypothetical protein